MKSQIFTIQKVLSCQFLVEYPFFTLWLYIMEVKYLVNIDFKSKFENTREKKVVSKQVS